MKAKNIARITKYSTTFCLTRFNDGVAYAGIHIANRLLIDYALL